MGSSTVDGRNPNHCWLVFTRKLSFQGFSGGAGFCPSAVCLSPDCRLEWRFCFPVRHLHRLGQTLSPSQRLHCKDALHFAAIIRPEDPHIGTPATHETTTGLNQTQPVEEEADKQPCSRTHLLRQQHRQFRFQRKLALKQYPPTLKKELGRSSKGHALLASLPNVDWPLYHGDLSVCDQATWEGSYSKYPLCLLDMF